MASSSSYTPCAPPLPKLQPSSKKDGGFALSSVLANVRLLILQHEPLSAAFLLLKVVESVEKQAFTIPRAELLTALDGAIAEARLGPKNLITMQEAVEKEKYGSNPRAKPKAAAASNYAGEAVAARTAGSPPEGQDPAMPPDLDGPDRVFKMPRRRPLMPLGQSRRLEGSAFLSHGPPSRPSSGASSAGPSPCVQNHTGFERQSRPRGSGSSPGITAADRHALWASDLYDSMEHFHDDEVGSLARSRAESPDEISESEMRQSFVDET
eukprot:TRINITY_DN23947_c0_g1_i1.p1 TRINITY_DN23947_c0_g1~~TRINITY_DN23947_c0_g1_i1.p1  ORF type:complete len:267 (-),score=43.42 TRINITY_DN23947_c0_g1_i1:276-1076(-)